MLSHTIPMTDAVISPVRQLPRSKSVFPSRLRKTVPKGSAPDNPQSELRIVHTRTRFDDLEARGNITRVKDRVHPRLKIHDGYASEISTGCGLTRSVQPPISVPKADYETQPSEWDVNSPNWSLKAIELTSVSERSS